MAGTGNGNRTPKKPTVQNGKTKPFSTVNSRDVRLAKERQRRQYEQQKKEKIIFALFVVIIIVLILIAILVFKRAIDKGEAADSQTDTDTVNTADTGTSEPPEELDNYLREMCAKDQIFEGNLIFVDSTYPSANSVELAEIYSGRTKFQKGEKTVYSYYTADTTPKLSTEALAALNEMADDFYELMGNNDLYVNKAYDASAANDHAAGLAVDLSVYTINHELYVLDDERASSDFDWVFNNYYKYGFVIESPAEAGERYYHFRYVGIPAAAYMFKNNIGLGDFLKLLRDEHAFGDGNTNAISVTTDDGAKYEMYYVAATGGDMTSVPIPRNALFSSISGDNMNGFVVTVRIG